MKKTVMVIGSGGREHALSWKLATSPRVGKVVVVPGNDGIALGEEAVMKRWADFSLKPDQFEALAEKAVAEKVDLAVIGPDQPLADGIVDVFKAYGILTFGPTAAAAEIEASKAFAKEVMKAAQVPTARYFVAKSLEEAGKILKSVPWPPEKGLGWVIKADGLALGKGVRVCKSKDEALQAVKDLIQISPSLVIEECLQGEELSWLAFCDGTRCALFEPARDYKQLQDHHQGPNTGGMGAFSPVPGLSPTLSERIRREVFLPVLLEMRKRGCEYRGILYAGLMLNPRTDRFWVLEFNSRFGDPEAQVLLPRMSTDLYDWCEAAALGDLKDFPDRVPFSKEAAVVVVAASEGYPEKPILGRKINLAISPPSEIPKIFFAGVRKEGNDLVTAGGRVLGALGVAQNLGLARKLAYQNLEQVKFEGMTYRSDIAKVEV